MPVRIDLQNMEAFWDVLDLLRRIYQHERCPPELQSYIRFEAGKYFAKDIGIKEFLEGK